MEQPVYRQKASKRAKQPAFDSPLVISEKEPGDGSNFQPKKIKQSIVCQITSIGKTVFFMDEVAHGSAPAG